MTNAERRQMMVAFIQGMAVEGSVVKKEVNNNLNKESVGMSKVLRKEDNVTLVDFLNNGGTMDEAGAMVGAKCAKVVIKGGVNKITVPSKCNVELVVEDGTNDITIVDGTVEDLTTEECSVWNRLLERQASRLNK